MTFATHSEEKSFLVRLYWKWRIHNSATFRFARACWVLGSVLVWLLIIIGYGIIEETYYAISQCRYRIIIRCTKDSRVKMLLKRMMAVSTRYGRRSLTSHIANIIPVPPHSNASRRRRYDSFRQECKSLGVRKSHIPPFE